MVFGADRGGGGIEVRAGLGGGGRRRAFESLDESWGRLTTEEELDADEEGPGPYNAGGNGVIGEYVVCGLEVVDADGGIIAFESEDSVLRDGPGPVGLGSGTGSAGVISLASDCMGGGLGSLRSCGDSIGSGCSS